MDKAHLRREFLEKRLAISRSGYWTQMDKIMEQIALINWSNSPCTHIFLPIRKNNEIDTFSIINYLKLEQPQVKIVVPRTDFEKLSIDSILYNHEYTILGRNKYDIPEPIHGSKIPSEEIDIVFLPLIACDLKGNRVGYGKGFYDRFLKGCRADAKKIGLSFFDPIVEISDVNEFDIPLDICISPSKTWVFRE
ncbi:5-formyltetrahydrofolate cyclo-ligase [Daejeonella lutea]|uniref:5-formyltetrahydrofolate cyclo-ligase n=1 Tax=Daejeonella lutea TaxID=572036 RepID=A0A1T5DLF3_9SPHI|nr:5-formyltetrahydrofolate cyclo-ligase [Daejeonella lutea]SKB72518.1 5-formyltetrahydrofolate cyclo-ligase [Daejeonella lutea]